MRYCHLEELRHNSQSNGELVVVKPFILTVFREGGTSVVHLSESDLLLCS